MSIDIACYYMTLLEGSSFSPSLGGWMGQEIFGELVAAARRGVKIRIVQQLPSRTMPDDDVQNLTRNGYAHARSIDFKKVMKDQGGILHTKMLIVDNVSAYIGSANMGTAEKIFDFMDRMRKFLIYLMMGST